MDYRSGGQRRYGDTSNPVASGARKFGKLLVLAALDCNPYSD
jgi:hypothetical protein